VTHTPAKALATEIGSQIAGLTLGTDLFHSTMRAPDGIIPINCVFVWGSGGLPPQRTHGDPDEIRRAIVNVQVRDRKFNAGDTLIRSILDALRGDDIATYLEIKVGDSEPLNLGQDGDGNHIMALSYIMTYIAE